MRVAFSLARNNCPSYSGRYYHHVTVEISINATQEATLTICLLHERTYGQVGLHTPVHVGGQVKQPLKST